MAVPATILSLFSGAGGLELGLKLVLPNSRVIAFVEGEAYAAAHLVARMEAGQLDQAPIWDDVSTFDGKPWRGVVDLVSGGFPCQDISDAGLRKGIIEGKRSALWFEMARIIREVAPEWVFVENVDSLVIRGLDFVLWSLAEMGFDAEWGVLGADECGAPHQRDRAFVLGHAQRCRHNRRALEPWWGSKQRTVIEGAGESMAHPNDRRQQGERGSGVLDGIGQAFRNDVDGRERPATSLDYSNCRRCKRQDDNVRSGWDRPERTGSEVANSPSKCRSQQPLIDDGRRALECAIAGAICGIESENLAAGVSLRRRIDAAGSTGLPTWPPSPADVLAWRAVPEILEPALCRMAHGMANRVDDLRACGNGVVPVVAAVAFLALRERLVAA